MPRITLRHRAASRYNAILTFALALLLGSASPSLFAQPQDPRHYFAGGNAVPGELAFQALLANPYWVAKVQPVQIFLPDGAVASVWNETAFEETGYQNPTVGLTIGPVYRIQISQIPRAGASVVYPSIELLNQLTPPPGLETRFPIRVALAEEDLRAAAAGQMVVKVIYLENPDTALPYRQRIDDQPFIDVGETEDPLRTAERLGRPMAIVRLGSRIPTADELNLPQAVSGVALTVFPQNQARELDQRQKTITQASLSSPSPESGAVSGYGTPPQVATPDHGDGNCSCCSKQGWQGFSSPPPLWSNELPLPGSPQRPNRDEFLCDGADRNLQVVIGQDGELVGLDMEDTVGRFDTLHGKTKIAVSNQVCIYSPRFAAVRKISRSFTTTDTARLATYRTDIELDQTSITEGSSLTVQKLQVQGNKATSRAGSFLDQTRGVLADNVLRPSGFRHGFEAYENLQLIRLGKHRNSESARLRLGMQAANVWEDAEGLQVAKRKIQPIITRDPLQVQEIRSVESENNSQLRLFKVASKIAAESGEEVEFTIRFDNIGADIIGNVTIVDNLTTRLEYVPDSAECSVTAQFTAEENEGGSLVLSWEISDPLQVGEGGVIRFRCRVR